MSAAVGDESVRAGFFWSRIQPYADATQLPAGTTRPSVLGTPTDFRSTDAIVAAAARRRLAVLPLVQWPPSWAATQPAAYNSTPTDYGAVQRVFTALAQRYGPGGSFWHERPGLPRLPIRAWQVFNEPNITRYWRTQPFATTYVATLQAAARGIRAATAGCRCG